MEPTSRFRLLYQTAGTSQMRLLNIVALSFCVAGLGLAFLMFKAPSATMSTEQSRHGWVLFTTLFALVCPLWAWSYGRRIATRILLSMDGRTLRVFHDNLLGTSARDIPVSDVELAAASAGDEAGEEELSPSRLEVAVRGQPNFVVAFNRGALSQKKRLLETLRPNSPSM